MLAITAVVLLCIRMPAVDVYKPAPLPALQVLGVIALIDGGQTDWKVLGISTEDPMAEKARARFPTARARPGFLCFCDVPLLPTFAVERGRGHRGTSARTHPRCVQCAIIAFELCWSDQFATPVCICLRQYSVDPSFFGNYAMCPLMFHWTSPFAPGFCCSLGLLSLSDLPLCLYPPASLPQPSNTG